MADFGSRKSKSGLVKLLIKLVLILLLIWMGGLLQFAASLPFEVDQPGQKTDAIVVLTGGTKRINAGAELLVQGLAKKLLISGVNPQLRQSDIRQLLTIANAENLLDCCITIDRRSSDTVGNARETARWAKKETISSLRLVTGSYHMPRSLLVLEYAIPKLTIIPHPVFSDKVKQADWWKYPGTSRLLAWEYCKYLVRLMRIQLMDRD